MVVEVNLFCLFVFCLFFVSLLLFSFAVCGLTGESRNKRTGLINVPTTLPLRSTSITTKMYSASIYDLWRKKKRMKKKTNKIDESEKPMARADWSATQTTPAGGNRQQKWPSVSIKQ